MSRIKTAIGLALLLCCASPALQANALPAIAAITGKEPAAAAKTEPLVQGGLLGAISSSIDDVQ